MARLAYKTETRPQMPRASALVSMELDDEDKADMAMPEMPSGPDYPYGLRICLTDAELERLAIDGNCEVGDVLYFRACAAVTSVSQNESVVGGKCTRIELQIEDMAVDDEAAEGEAE